MQKIAQIIAEYVSVRMLPVVAKNFRDEHPLQGAFLSNKLIRLVDLIGAQGTELLRDAGIELPSNTVALTLYVGDKGQASLVEIAKALDEVHQLSATRVDSLIHLGLMERRDDPTDRRRKALSLTSKGKAQYSLLLKRLSEIEAAMTGLYAEIGYDLPAILEAAMDALSRQSLLERIQKTDAK